MSKEQVHESVAGARAFVPTVEEILSEAAKLPTFEFATHKKEFLDKLAAIGAKVTTKELTTEIDRRRKAGGTTQSTDEGESLAPAAPQPWSEPVAVNAVLDELCAFVKRFVVVNEHALVAITLWVAFTYFFDIAETSPRLAILSPTKRCGKTRALEVLLMLCLRPVSASNLSPSAIFRMVDLEHPTLIIDEADTWNANKNDELRGILNSDHTPANAFVIRNVPIGDKEWMPHKFSTWCPIAMAAIGKLPETWLDRSIVIPMQRKLGAVKVERLTRRNRQAREQAAVLSARLARLGVDNLDVVRTANPMIPNLTSDRAVDNWEHLCAIAELGGPEWANKARIAALALTGSEAANEASSLGEMLLADLRELFKNSERLTSAHICEKLAEHEDRPWPEYRRGKPITPKQLASLLRPFGIAPATIDGIAKGYRRDWFKAVFSQYLGDESESEVTRPRDSKRPNVQPTGGVSESGDFTSVQGNGLDGSKKCGKPNTDEGSDGWTDQNPEKGLEI
jgi:putative DNA primase/helicase